MLGRRAGAEGPRRQPPAGLERHWQRASERGGDTHSVVVREAKATVAEAEVAVSCLLTTIVAVVVEGGHADELRPVAQSATVEREHLYLLWDELDRLEGAARNGTAREDEWRDLQGRAAQSRARSVATEARVPRGGRHVRLPLSPVARRPRTARRRGASD